jgi:scyllo-inositol 2-dehydrogenase (NADP+)
MHKKINVGLIGFGIGGQIFHAPIITSVDGLNLYKIRATNPDHISVAKLKYPDALIVSDTDEIINDSVIDLVVITTPNVEHFPIAHRALEAGKDVVVDKPFTIHSHEADELIALAADKKRMLSVFQSRRFDSDFKTVQRVINSGLLGEIAEIESRYDRFRNFLKPKAWREEKIPGSGILYDLGSHLIDQAIALVGLPQAITADTRLQRKASTVDDNFELILHYDAGLKVTLKSGMLVREPLQRFIILGNQGSFVKKGLDVQEASLKAGHNPLDTPEWGVEPPEIWGIINTTINGVHIRGNVESDKGDYTTYYKNVYEVISRGISLLVTAEEARNVIRVIELAMQSNQEKRTIVYTNRG